MLAYGIVTEEQKGISFRDSFPGRADIPVFTDSVWVDTLPSDKQVVPFDLQDPIDDYGFGRICIDRHKLAINLSFADGHAGRVILEDLWKLKWNKTFSPVDVTVPAR